MTITSVGYTGTVSATQWGQMLPRVGSAFYSVDDATSFKVSITVGTRAISVAAGGASAVGIYDVSNAAIPKSLASVPSGTRWDLVVLRRTWATKVTSVEIIQGGSSKVIPERNVNTGTVHDQPLALARVDAAAPTVIQEIVDLRCIAGDGGFVAFNTLALSYLNRVGTQVRIGDFEWTLNVNSAGSPTWTHVDVTPDTGWVDVSKNGGWTWGAGQVRRIGSTITLRLVATRPTWSATNNLAQLTGPFRPDAAWYVSSSHTTGKTEFVIDTTGRVNANQNSGGATGVTIHTSYPAARPTI